MGETNWQVVRLKAWAVIAGIEYDVVRVSANYELNGIPSVQLTLPVGRDIQRLQAAAIHTGMQKFKQQQTLKVYAELQISAQSRQTPAMASLFIEQEGTTGEQSLAADYSGKYLIFEGYTSGTGYYKSQEGRAEFTVNGVGKLVDMAFSSALSDSSHPGNPSDYSSGAMIVGSKAGNTATDGIAMADDFITTGNIKEDLWGKALLPWFRELTELDAIQIQERNILGSSKNSDARAGLDLLDPATVDRDNSSLQQARYPKMAVRTDVDENLLSHITAHISNQTLDPGPIANMTLWDMLVGALAPDFMFAVVPRIKSGFVVPFVPALRPSELRGPWRTIHAENYNTVQLTSDTPRPLRAIGILSSIGTRDGVDLTHANSPPHGVGGWYEGRETGQIMIRNCPGWMGQLTAMIDFASTSSGANLKVMGNAADPGQGEAPEDNPKDAAPRRLIEVIQPLLDAYAQYVYVIESVKQRQGTLSGPLRFDIAPGSLVKIEGSGENFIPEDQLGLAFYANVLRVTLYLDAEAQKAGTAFHLGYIRSEADVTDDDTSILKHPLYENTFLGCPLLDGPEPVFDDPDVGDADDGNLLDSNDNDQLDNIA